MNHGQAHITQVHDITVEQKNADELLKLIRQQIAYLTTNVGLLLIGVCTDASGESQAAHLHLLSEMPWLLIVDCWAHQVQLTIDFEKDV